MNTAFKTSLLSGLLGTSALIMTTALAPAAMAQTTSGVAGYVTSESAAPVSGATVTVTNTATGFTRTVVTGSDGYFAVRNLSVTGMYDVTVAGNGYQGERVEGLNLSLGNTSTLNFALAGGAYEDEVVVVAQRQVLADVAVGPNANFGLTELVNAPTINRNIADVIRLDPRVYIDESRGDINSVQCVGQSSRFNSITVDGVNFNDAFGLNSNGYPTERMPFPFDAIEQVSVEIAPFDVEYSDFTACAINSVTKSGTNEFHGGAFIDYTNDGLRGDKVDGIDLTWGDFDEIRYGVHVGGPIIKDKLFFHAAYEKLDGANTYIQGPLLNGSITQAQVDEITQIARDVYQYDPGTFPNSLDNSDEKLLVKLDWNISDQHRASFTYDYNDGFNTVRSDGDSNELEFGKHFYERGTRLDTIVGALYSDWTDNFSTELIVDHTKTDGRQDTVGGTDFGEMQIRVGSNTVYLGGDDSRQSNNLDWDRTTIAAKANYNWDNHTFTFGGRYQDLSIFNLFIQHTETEIRFNSIDDFRNQLAQRIYYNNSPSHNPDNAAADWGYQINSLFAQDEFTLGDALTVVAGLRYDWYTSSDTPVENPDFVADYGFSNAQNFDGEGLLQPRLGITWDAKDDLQIRGGIGRYSGGNPNVWLSNNYSSNNVTQVGALARAGRGAFSGVSAIDLSALTYVGAEAGVPNSAGWAIPTVVYDSVSTGIGSNFEINYLDPNFKLPSQWKYALGATWTPDFNTGEDLFGGEWMFQTDVLFTQNENTAIIQRGDLVKDGTRVVDGVTYPTYDSPLMDSFKLTNADIESKAFVFSFGGRRAWDNGLSWTFGYAYSDAEDVQPMTSSVAFSNYNNRAFTDPQEQIAAVSNYNIKHRFTSSLSYDKEFWEDYNTNFFVYFQSNSGRPYSRVYGEDGTDANDFYRFTPYLEGSILLPGTQRNEFTGPSWTKVDLKISQEIPGLRADDRAKVFLTIDNLTNLINDEWGVLRQPSFPRTLTERQPLSLQADASAYEIRFGMSYDF